LAFTPFLNVLLVPPPRRLHAHTSALFAPFSPRLRSPRASQLESMVSLCFPSPNPCFPHFSLCCWTSLLTARFTMQMAIPLSLPKCVSFLFYWILFWKMSRYWKCSPLRLHPRRAPTCFLADNPPFLLFPSLSPPFFSASPLFSRTLLFQPGSRIYVKNCFVPYSFSFCVPPPFFANFLNDGWPQLLKRFCHRHKSLTPRFPPSLPCPL